MLFPRTSTAQVEAAFLEEEEEAAGGEEKGGGRFVPAAVDPDAISSGAVGTMLMQVISIPVRGPAPQRVNSGTSERRSNSARADDPVTCGLLILVAAAPAAAEEGSRGTSMTLCLSTANLKLTPPETREPAEAV